MKPRAFALMISAVLLLSAAFLVVDFDDSDAAAQTVFKGVIKDGAEPVYGATVRIGWKNHYEETKTDEDGKFTITINEDSSVDPGNATISCEHGIYLKKSDFKLNYEETPGVYNLDNVEWNTFIIQTVLVHGYVKSGGNPIEGATVTLETNDKNDQVTSSYITKTKSDGKYEFKCLPGEYTLKVERSGFEDVPPVTVKVTGPMTFPQFNLILLEEKTYWGLDLAHIFTVAGLIIAGVSLVLVRAYAISLKRHPEKSRLIDDDFEN